MSIPKETSRRRIKIELHKEKTHGGSYLRREVREGWLVIMFHTREREASKVNDKTKI